MVTTMSFSSDATARDTPVHEKVIYAVANADGVDPVDMAPLYDTIDPEALDAIFDGGGRGRIAFTYEGHEVAVTCDDDAVADVEVDVRPVRTLGFGDDAGASAAGQ